MLRIHLWNRVNSGFKAYHGIGTDIRQRCIGTHPGCPRRGVNSEQALPPVEEIRRIAGDFEGRERPRPGVLRHGVQKLFGCVVEQTDLPGGRGVLRASLLQVLDHHIVGGFVNERNQHILPVHPEGSVRVLFHRRLGNLPDKVPSQHIGQSVAQLFHQVPVHIACLGGSHEGHRPLLPAQLAFGAELFHKLIRAGRVKPHAGSAKTVHRVRHQTGQRHHGVLPSHVGCDVIRVRYADMRRGSGGDIGNDIVVYLPVIGVQAQFDVDIGIQCLKFRNSALVDVRLPDVGVVLRPEHDLVFTRLVKALRNRKGRPLLPSVATAQCGGHGDSQQNQCKAQGKHPPCRINPARSHPLVPPLETPSMMRRRKTRNSTISGTDTTTTVAIMAGIFSRPNPFSRIS